MLPSLIFATCFQLVRPKRDVGLENLFALSLEDTHRDPLQHVALDNQAIKRSNDRIEYDEALMRHERKRNQELDYAVIAI